MNTTGKNYFPAVRILHKITQGFLCSELSERQKSCLWFIRVKLCWRETTLNTFINSCLSILYDTVAHYLFLCSYRVNFLFLFLSDKKRLWKGILWQQNIGKLDERIAICIGFEDFFHHWAWGVSLFPCSFSLFSLLLLPKFHFYLPKVFHWWTYLTADNSFALFLQVREKSYS